MPRKKKDEDFSNLLNALDMKLKQSFDHRSQIKEEVISADSQNSTTSASCTLEDSSSVVLKSKMKIEPISKLQQLKKALEINTQMSHLLQTDMERIQLAAERNLKKQAVLKEVISEDQMAKAQCRPPSSVRAISVFAAPYFRDTKRMVPPLNEDAIIKRKNFDVNAYLTPPKPWNREENKKLLDGVTSYALMSAIKPYKIRRDHIKNKLKDKSNLTDDDVLNLEELLAEVETDIKEVSTRPLHELLDELQGNFDWMTISSVNLEGTRSPEECEALWNNFLDFSINKEVFDDVEDSKLRDLAEDYNERNWDGIAKSLKTNRTAIQCFERYQTRLSSNLTKRYWTPEEDKHLVDLVASMRVGKIIPWNKVCLEMEGRTRQQVINRYERSISQAYNRGPWATEEDALLIGCVHKFGMRWAKMKPYFMRRSSYSIRERYVNALDPDIKMGCWSKDEDKLLIALIRMFGYGKWSKICKHIPGRTDNMCLVRAGRLLEHSVKFLSDCGRDIDIDVHDPVLFARILKPLAPTKCLVHRNVKLKSVRDDATDTFLMVVQKVVPSFVVRESSLDSYDFSFLNSDILHQVSEELHRMMEERERENRPFVRKCWYVKKPLRRSKRVLPSESDNEIEVYQEEEPAEMPMEEKIWLHTAISELFKIGAKVLPPYPNRTFAPFNKRELAESTLFKAYLYKAIMNKRSSKDLKAAFMQFQCKAICDEDDDLENVTFNGIDYSETLQTVVSYFIQPPVYESQFIVLAPNLTTIGGMEVMEATEDRLKSMSELVRYSTPYMDYICERTPVSPTCLQCLSQKNAEIGTKVSPQIMISDMAAKYFIVDDTLKKAAHVESASHELCDESCCCNALEKSRNSVRLLRQRFMGLFLWPALLASTKFSPKQENILCKQQGSDMEKGFYLRMLDRGRPPGRKNKPNTGFVKRKRKRKRSCSVKVSKCNKSTKDVTSETELMESSNAIRNIETSSSYILPTEALYPNSLPSVASCSYILPTEVSPCLNSLPTEVSPGLNSLPTEQSCLNGLPTDASCSYILPTEVPCSNSLPTPASCSYSLPTEASCSYHLVPHIKKIKTEPSAEKKKYSKRFQTSPSEIRKSKRMCVLRRRSFAYPASSEQNGELSDP